MIDKRPARRVAAALAVVAVLVTAGASSAAAVEGSGAEVATEVRPWMGRVEIAVDVPLLPDPTGLCGATLVTPVWALTAQHCVEDVEPGALAVTFATNRADGTGGWRTRVAAIERHPDYVSAPLANDVALLRLTGTAPPDVRPVRLATDAAERARLHLDSEATIMGWGGWAEGARSDVLRQGRMTVNLVTGQYIGARPVERAFGAWTGTGDSGGPILVGEGDDAVQVGVVSGGDTEQEQNSVFNRVDAGSAHWRWIAETTGLTAPDVPADTGPPVAGYAAAPTSSWDGYWTVDPDGEVHTTGDARSFGSMAGEPLNAPVVAIAPTPDDAGYWLVAADGGVFAFGDARFLGSMGGRALNEPVSGMAATPSGDGYWLVAEDGGVFAFGDATFHGSLGANPPGARVLSITPTPSGRGYWLTDDAGRVHRFGDAADL